MQGAEGLVEFLREGLGRMKRKESGGKRRSSEVRCEGKGKSKEENGREKETWRNRGQSIMRKAGGHNIYQSFVQYGLGGS